MFDITSGTTGIYRSEFGDVEGTATTVNEEGVWVLPFRDGDPIFIEWDELMWFGEQAVDFADYLPPSDFNRF